MEPSVPSGTVLLLSKVDVKSVVYGNDYVVQTSHFVTLRRVRRDEGGDKSQLRLEADNPQRFDDIVVRQDDVETIFAVKARIILKN